MKKRTVRRAFLVPGVLILGVVIMGALIVSRKAPGQVERPPAGALVEVLPVHRTDREVLVNGYGDIDVLHRVNVSPQVTGQVVWTSPELVNGGAFHEGDEMLRIDPRDYQLRVQQAEATVAQAKVQLDLAGANAAIAREEWDMEVKRNGAAAGQPDALVLHEPQLKQAEANLLSAQAALEQAKLNLDRTMIRAPFNCRVESENVSPGQQVGPQSMLAQIYSTDIAEIEVSLQPSDLEYIEIPGSRVEIICNPGESHDTRFEGEVHRQVGVIGQRGRLAWVVVRIRDPFESDNPHNPGLSLGAFVEARIHGRVAHDIYPIPRAGLHLDNTVWVSTDSSLEIRKVEVYYKTTDEIFVSSGLRDGDLVVMTPISGAADGLALRPVMPGNGE